MLNSRPFYNSIICSYVPIFYNYVKNSIVIVIFTCISYTYTTYYTIWVYCIYFYVFLYIKISSATRFSLETPLWAQIYLCFLHFTRYNRNALVGTLWFHSSILKSLGISNSKYCLVLWDQVARTHLMFRAL